MRSQIIHQGTAPMVEIELEVGESVKAESGAMVAMSPTIDLDGKLEGGLLNGIGRMFAGEKFFFQTLTASRGNGKVLLAPSCLGGIEEIELDGSYGLRVQKDGFLAGSSGIEVSTQMQNLAKGLFSGEGFFILNIRGRGKVFVNSLGAIHPINLAAGEEMVIDNGHLVAWADTMNYTIEKASKGWISSITSGECLVCRFRGPGVVLIQSRNPLAFAEWINGYIPPSNNK